MIMDIQTVAKCNIFTRMNEDEVEDVLSKITFQQESFRKGDILAMQDEPCNRLIILVKGSVKAEMADPSGKVVKVEDIEAPSPLAILFLFGEENHFPVQVTAREAVDVIIIPKQAVIRMLSMNEQLLKNYLDISAHYASALSRKLHLMSFRTIRQKLAIYLLNLSKSNPDKFELDRTQNALAEYFGVSRPALARELGSMQVDKLISISNRYVTILDKHKLIQLVKF